MNNREIPLTDLPPERKAKVVRIEGGFGLQNKLRVMGIREGQVIRIISKQFFQGPITVVVNGCQVTLGRGMAQRIIVEVM